MSGRLILSIDEFLNHRLSHPRFVVQILNFVGEQFPEFRELNEKRELTLGKVEEMDKHLYDAIRIAVCKDGNIKIMLSVNTQPPTICGVRVNSAIKDDEIREFNEVVEQLNQHQST